MQSIRFIHTADAHLGSILRIRNDSRTGDLVKITEKAVLEGFRRVCDSAITEGVDFMVIAGDLYDLEMRSISAQDFFVKQCQRLENAKIDVFIIAGNHDPLGGAAPAFRLPANVKIFSADRPQVYEVAGRDSRLAARLVGQSYQTSAETRKIHTGYDLLNKDVWNIALLHTQLEPGASNYVPCSPGELTQRGDIHYWALGHIHKRRIVNDDFPFAAYPGIPQGRHFGEQGRGGCLLVELSAPAQDVITFIPTAPVVYQRVELFVDADPKNVPQTLPELEEKIAAQAAGILAAAAGDEGAHSLWGLIVEWVIRGRSEIYDLIKTPEQEGEALDLLIDNLRARFESTVPFLWTNSLIFRLKPIRDYESILKGSPVLAELDAVIEKCRSDAETRKKLAQQLGRIWSGHGDEEAYRARDEFLFNFDQEALEDFLETARQLIIEELAEGRE